MTILGRIQYLYLHFIETLQGTIHINIHPDSTSYIVCMLL